MSLGSSIQATLGLDASRFTAGLDKGVAQAKTKGQQMGRQLSQGIGGPRLANALLAALAIDPQKIANKIAEFFTGGSQEAFKAGAEAADRFAEAFDARRFKRMSLEQRDTFLQREEQRAVQRLMDADKITNQAKRTQEIAEANLQILNAQIAVEENRAAMKAEELRKAQELANLESQTGALRRAAAMLEMSSAEQLQLLNRELLNIEQERDALAEGTPERMRADIAALQKIAEIKAKELADAKELDRLQKELTKLNRDASFAELESADQLKVLRGELGKLEAARNATAAGTAERLRAEIEIAKKVAEIKAKEATIEQQRLRDAEAQKALQDAKVKALERELEAQEKIVESIKKQREEFKASVREAERIRNLPTLGQVASGERFIGGRAGREARELGRIQTTEQRLTDRRQRLQEQLDAARAEPGGSTSGRAAAIEKQLQDVNEKLGEAAGRRGQLEDALRQRVADIGQSQLEQLQQINGELAEAKAALDEINQSLTEEATR